jgi:hypothetical protein
MDDQRPVGKRRLILLAVAVIAIALVAWWRYSIHWIEQRRQELLRLNYHPPGITGYAMHENKENMPFSLWVWGDEMSMKLFWYDSSRGADEMRAQLDRVRRLFPEAKLIDESQGYQ